MYLMDSFTARLESHIRNRGDNIVPRELYASASVVTARAKAHASSSNSTNNSTNNSTSNSANNSTNDSRSSRSNNNSAPPSPVASKKELAPESSIVRCPSGSPVPIELERTLRFDLFSEVGNVCSFVWWNISDARLCVKAWTYR